VGYGNVKYCQGETEGRLLCGHFPFIASLFIGLDRGAGVMSRLDLVEVESGSSRYLEGRDSIDMLSVRDDRSRTLLADYIDMPQYRPSRREKEAALNNALQKSERGGSRNGSISFRLYHRCWRIRKKPGNRNPDAWLWEQERKFRSTRHYRYRIQGLPEENARRII
jgi:hypothetical protein